MASRDQTTTTELSFGLSLRKTQTHLFLDAGVTYDHARDATEKAAGIGMGLSYYHDRFTLSGAIGLPLVQDNRIDIGSPVAQIRMDLKAW